MHYANTYLSKPVVPDVEIVEGNVDEMINRDSERKGAEALGSTGK